MFLVGTVVFFTFRVLPGNPASLILGMNPTPAAIHHLNQQMGLNKPLWVQYEAWAGQLLRGNLGVSSQLGLPVLPLVVTKAGVTLELALVAMILALVIAVPIGVYSAVHAGKTTDQVVRVLSMAGFSMPSYWLAILLMLLLSYKFPILPAGGYISFQVDPWSHIRYLILPAVTVAIIEAAPLVRFLRAGMLEVLSQDYIRTARSKGLRETTVIYRHALRNAAVPLITVAALNFGGLIGGLVVTEQVYAWPGIGWQLVQAIFNRDYNVVEGIVLISALVFVSVNLVVDVLYAVLDPRITYG